MNDHLAEQIEELRASVARAARNAPPGTNEAHAEAIIHLLHLLLKRIEALEAFARGE